MNKDRVAAFMDAVIAIVMTILVLELEKPAAPTLAAFWDLRVDFLAYALTFLWLASMWMSLHNAWQVVSRISTRTIKLSMLLLFFSSLFPYATSLVSEYFYSKVVQGVYGLIVILTTMMLILIYNSLADDDRKEWTTAYMTRVNRILMIDVGIKAAGVVLGLLFWPPLISFGILAAALFTTITKRHNPVGKI